MFLTALQKRKLRISLKLIAFGICAGIFFVLLSDGADELYPILNGAIIGLLIAVIASIFEFYLYERSIRQHRFITVLIIRSLFYLFIILTIMVAEIGIARMIKEKISVSELLKHEAFNYYLFGGEFMSSFFYTLALVIIINFSRQISRKLGHGVITSLITGRYYHPREQEKVFMFLNIPSSQAIIDQITRMNFHLFINEIVYDITLPILSNNGIIYQYVEDEIVIVWNYNSGTVNATSIRCFFDLKDKIHEQREKYLRKYGVYPSFKAAIHCGQVVKGEIGYIKTEIVYHGDVMNTTSRILDACHKMDKEIIISNNFLEAINLPVIYESTKCGDIQLKGKKDPMELFTIEEIDIKSMAFK